MNKKLRDYLIGGTLGLVIGGAIVYNTRAHMNALHERKFNDMKALVEKTAEIAQRGDGSWNYPETTNFFAYFQLSNAPSGEREAEIEFRYWDTGTTEVYVNYDYRLVTNNVEGSNNITRVYGMKAIDAPIGVLKLRGAPIQVDFAGTIPKRKLEEYVTANSSPHK